MVAAISVLLERDNTRDEKVSGPIHISKLKIDVEGMPAMSETDVRRPTPAQLLERALTLRCPNCGFRGIFSNWLTMKERCPRCNWLFEREEGYFLGGYALNLIVAEFLAVAIVVAVLLFSDLSTGWVQLLGAFLAIALPILFFPFSRTLWIALDLALHPQGSEPRE